MENKKAVTIYINGRPIGSAFIVDEKPKIEKSEPVKQERFICTGTFKLNWKTERLLAIKQFFGEMN